MQAVFTSHCGVMVGVWLRWGLGSRRAREEGLEAAVCSKACSDMLECAGCEATGGQRQCRVEGLQASCEVGGL